jgi:hypothetical protein
MPRYASDLLSAVAWELWTLPWAAAWYVLGRIGWTLALLALHGAPPSWFTT